MRIAVVLLFSLVLSGCFEEPAGKFSAYINRDREPDSGFIPSTILITPDGEKPFHLRHQASYAWMISPVKGTFPKKDVVLSIFDPEQELKIFISHKTAYKYQFPNPALWPQTTVLSPEETGLNYELRIQVVALKKERTVPYYTQCIKGKASQESTCSEHPGGTYGEGEYDYFLSVEFWNEQGELVVTLI